MKEEKKMFKIGEPYDAGIAEMNDVGRKDSLESIAYSVEQRSYTKNLTDEELSERKTELAEVSIKLNELDKEKKRLNDEIKVKIQIPKDKHVSLLETIEHRSERRNGMIYGIDDQENGLMYSFDDEAICVEIRALNRDEKQTFLKMNKTGTDGK